MAGLGRYPFMQSHLLEGSPFEVVDRAEARQDFGFCVTSFAQSYENGRHGRSMDRAGVEMGPVSHTLQTDRGLLVNQPRSQSSSVLLAATTGGLKPNVVSSAARHAPSSLG